MIHLNYSVTLYNHGAVKEMSEHFKLFEQLYNEEDAKERDIFDDITNLRNQLNNLKIRT